MSGLNTLSETIEHSGIRIEPEEDKDLLEFMNDIQNVIDSSRHDVMDENLHSTVIRLTTQNKMHELEKILLAVDNVETFNQLKGIFSYQVSYFYRGIYGAVIPHYCKMDKRYQQYVHANTTKEKPEHQKMAIVYLYEGARQFSTIFSKPSNKQIITQIVKGN